MSNNCVLTEVLSCSRTKTSTSDILCQCDPSGVPPLPNEVVGATVYLRTLCAP